MYCQKCGALIEADEETRVAGREYRAPTLRAPTTPSAKAAATALVQEGSSDQEIFSISPTLKFVYA
ncbi:MAG: hypothetical protein ABR535_08750, partial [Pyrinomonadaceae bacterium]